jgi:hypothetical protein
MLDWPSIVTSSNCYLVWSLLSDWCNFGGIPLAAWPLGGKTAMRAFPHNYNHLLYCISPPFDVFPLLCFPNTFIISCIQYVKSHQFPPLCDLYKLSWNYRLLITWPQMVKRCGGERSWCFYILLAQFCTAVGYQLNGQGSIPGRGNRFCPSQHADQLWPTQPSIQWVMGADQSLQSSSEVKNGEAKSPPPYLFMVWCLPYSTDSDFWDFNISWQWLCNLI